MRVIGLGIRRRRGKRRTLALPGVEAGLDDTPVPSRPKASNALDRRNAYRPGQRSAAYAPPNAFAEPKLTEYSARSNRFYDVKLSPPSPVSRNAAGGIARPDGPCGRTRLAGFRVSEDGQQSDLGDEVLLEAAFGVDIRSNHALNLHGRGHERIGEEPELVGARLQPGCPIVDERFPAERAGIAEGDGGRLTDLIAQVGLELERGILRYGQVAGLVAVAAEGDVGGAVEVEPMPETLDQTDLRGRGPGAGPDADRW